MKRAKFTPIILSLLLLNFSGRLDCLAVGQSAQAAAPADEIAEIRQQVEKLPAKTIVRVQLKSSEKITGRILARNENSVVLQTEKSNGLQPREIAYRDIQSIRSEEKLSIGIKVLSVVVAIAIVGVFAMVTHHRKG